MATSTPEFGFPVPQSTDPPRGYEQIEDLALAVETVLNLPARAEAFVGNTIAITATGFATLPSPGPVAVSMTNPSTVYGLECDVEFSAWINPNGALNVQGGVAASGGMTWTANGFGAGGPVANSDNMFLSATQSQLQHCCYPIIIPAGAAAVTFTLQAFRGNTAGSPAFNYPILRVIPRRFVAP